MRRDPSVCENCCSCNGPHLSTGLVVLTGGPGAGKTAVLEMAKKNFCHHIAILPEAASIVFGGGFWRLESVKAKQAAQRAIYHVQREMEHLVQGEKKWALGLCDRGSLDGLAYWPGDQAEFWSDVKSGLATELIRYQAVIHLRTPPAEHGYNHVNRLRIETPEEAQKIDERIAEIWSTHPRYVQIPSSENFLEKARQALQLIAEEIPKCCHPRN